MPHLVLSFLGGFQVAIDDHPLTGFLSNKVRALLAYLAVEAGRPHPRESLAALLWPEFPETAALANLRVALSDLRDRLHDRHADPPFLLVDRESIQLNPDADVWVDVWEFEGAVNEPGMGARGQRTRIIAPQSPISNQQLAISNLQSSISLYRGPFLAGFSIPDSAPFEEWLILNRERLSQQALRILHVLADFYESCGEYEQALMDARRQVELEPWLEEAHRQIMRLLALGEQPSQALAQYESCKRTLADELGIEPAAETTRLYETIRAGRFEEIRPGERLPFPGEPPYKGLRFFDETDAALFFGREALTALLVGHIREMVNAGASLLDHPGSPVHLSGSPLQFLTVVGASGSGKSSLVRAGLAPVLKQNGWQVGVITPTAHPMERLETGGEGKGENRRFLVIDQFEELFTLCRSEEERTAFLDRLLTPTPSPSLPQMKNTFGGGAGGGVVLVLRADFYGHCAQYPRLREALCARQEYIGPMSATELRQAIEQPALRNGWEFEAGLVELILRDIGASEGHPPEPGALPLLEHALLETWRRRSGRTLTLKGYAEAGGVHGAIAKTAESVFTGLTPEQQVLARRIFLRLTELGEGTQDMRRRASLSELTPTGEDISQTTNLLQALADARLITLAEGAAEVAHEALIREWPALRQWLSEDRDSLRLHRHLTDSAQAWAELERDADELYRGARLAQALEWAEAHPDDLNALEREYLQASQAQSQAQAVSREVQLQRELESAQQLMRTQQQALEHLKKSEALRLAAEANRLLIEGKDSQVAALLALRSLAQQYTVQGDEALSRASRLAYPLRIFDAHSSIRGITFNGDGAQIITNSVDNRVRLWNVASGKLLRTFQGEVGLGTGVEICADGGFIAANTITQVVVWNSNTGQELFSMDTRLILTDTQGISMTAALSIPVATFFTDISSDGRYLLVGHADGNARIWEIVTGKEVQRFPGHVGGPLSMVFSSDDRYVLTSDSGVNSQGKFCVRLWDARSGEMLHVFSQHFDVVQGLAFSPDGKTILTASQDQSACFWDFETGRLIRCIQAGTPLVFNAVFSPDGCYALGGGVDGAARLWDVSTGQEIRRYMQSQLLSGVAFSPDGKIAATASFDGAACLWATDPGMIQKEFSIPGVRTWGFDFSPDSRNLVVVFSDGTVKIWDVNTGQETANFTGPVGAIWAKYSVDGQVIFIPTYTSVFTLNAHTGITHSQFTLPESMLASADMAPDGKTIMIMDLLGTFFIVDAISGDILDQISKFKTCQTLVISPDSSRVAVGVLVGEQLNAVQTWIFSYPGMEKLLALDYPSDVCITAISFSSDGGKILAGGSGGNNNLILWDAVTGAKLQQFTGFTGMLTSVALSPDGRYATTGDTTGVARMWEVASSHEVRRFVGHTGGVNCIRFSPDGKWVATGGDDGAVRLWYVDLEELKAAMCSALPRDLTVEERARYGITDTSPTCTKFTQP